MLEAGGNSVRTAIVMGMAGVGRAEAERLLAASHGRVRQAMADELRSKHGHAK